MRPKTVLCTWATLALVAQMGGAQIPYLLSDMNPDNAPANYYQPRLLGALDNTLFFATEEPSLGLELWLSPGERRIDGSGRRPLPWTLLGRSDGARRRRRTVLFRRSLQQFLVGPRRLLRAAVGARPAARLVQSDDVRLAFLESPYPQGASPKSPAAVFVALRSDAARCFSPPRGPSSYTVQIFHFADVLDNRFPHGLTQVDASRVTFFLAPGSTNTSTSSGSRTVPRRARVPFARWERTLNRAALRTPVRRPISSPVRTPEATSGSRMGPIPEPRS